MTLTLEQIDSDFEIFLNSLRPHISRIKIKDAYEFAKKAHCDENQTRKDGTPYINHPLEVAKIVDSLGLDEIAIISALLHDTVEDTKITFDDIQEKFGEEVKYVVDALTKIENFENKKLSKEERNIAALRKILLASVTDVRVLVIKLCDRLHNMRTMGDMSEEQKRRISKETLLIYVPIAQKTGISQLKWELEDLSLKYRHPDEFQQIKENLGMKRPKREEIVKKAADEVIEVLNEHGYEDKVYVSARPKNIYSIYRKIRDEDKSFEDIYDLYAIRIIAKEITDCYAILGLIHEHFKTFPNRLKDYISNPKDNGYQSLHTLIFSKSINFPVEIQVRTEDMHKLAEFGVAAHWKYKNLTKDKKFEKKISWLREILEWEKSHKGEFDFLELLKYDFFKDEIFVFTPKNDLISLPEGATALDFAFAIHTEIGEKAHRAKVNGEMANLDKILKSGDFVEIITNNKVKVSERWLKIVKTTKAKIKIKSSLNLKYSRAPDEVQKEISFEDLKPHILRLEDYKKVRNTGCCEFNMGDNIVGVSPKRGELVIHNAKCENAKYSIHKKVPLNWKKQNNVSVSFDIYLKDSYGILIDIMNIFEEYNVNISNLKTNVTKDGSVTMKITMISGKFLDEMLEKIKSMESVVGVGKLKKASKFASMTHLMSFF